MKKRSIDPRLDNYDWEQAFVYAGGNGHPVLGYTGSLEGFTREDVSRIVAIDEGEADERDWMYEASETFTDTLGNDRYVLVSIVDTSGFFVDRFVDAPVEEPTAACDDGTIDPHAHVSQESQAPLSTQTFDFDAYNSLRGLPGRKE